MNPLSDRLFMLIQKYFKDDLSDQESTEFDQAMMTNEDFRKEIELQSTVLEGVVKARRAHLKSIIDEAKAELPSRESTVGTSTPTIGRKSITLIAVVFIALMSLVAFYYFNRSTQPNYPQIYAEYYKPYDTPEISRGTADVEETLLNRASFLYEDAQYRQALDIFESMLPSSEGVELLRANCLMNLDEFEKSETILTRLTSSSNIKIKQNAEWYLLMNNLKTGKIESANLILEAILSDPSHLFHSLALRIDNVLR